MDPELAVHFWDLLPSEQAHWFGNPFTLTERDRAAGISLPVCSGTATPVGKSF